MNDTLHLQWGPDGLIPAIAQDARTGQVLMQAYMSEESLRKTLETGTAWYWSRSRRRLWNKGESSGHVQRVLEIRVDCDGDALLLLVEQEGAACHAGTYSCFRRRVDGSPAWRGDTAFWPLEPGNRPHYDIGTLARELEQVLHQRRVSPDPESYTSQLFVAGSDAYCRKIAEEATEVILSAKNRDRENLSHEVADLWFHTLVALVDAAVPVTAVADQLASRRGKRRKKG
jgi:phosphoribosyl-AMP cyclohydrolase / phosphoribosyl-ATP pyrophosphohydrolase